MSCLPCSERRWFDHKGRAAAISAAPAGCLCGEHARGCIVRGNDERRQRNWQQRRHRSEAAVGMDAHQSGRISPTDAATTSSGKMISSASGRSFSYLLNLEQALSSTARLGWHSFCRLKWNRGGSTWRTTSRDFSAGPFLQAIPSSACALPTDALFTDRARCQRGKKTKLN